MHILHIELNDKGFFLEFAVLHSVLQITTALFWIHVSGFRFQDGSKEKNKTLKTYKTFFKRTRACGYLTNITNNSLGFL